MTRGSEWWVWVIIPCTNVNLHVAWQSLGFIWYETKLSFTTDVPSLGNVTDKGCWVCECAVSLCLQGSAYIRESMYRNLQADFSSVHQGLQRDWIFAWINQCSDIKYYLIGMRMWWTTSFLSVPVLLVSSIFSSTCNNAANVQPQWWGCFCFTNFKPLCFFIFFLLWGGNFA